MTITRFAPASTAVSFAEIEAHEFKHVQSIVTAPAPSGGDDTKAVQESYEELGKPGVVQLRNGTYKFDTIVKINKYAAWLRGMGASSMEVESKIVTAGTLITCNSRNKAAIEVGQSGSWFSDFALLNNANLELATLSEELKSSGAAITEIKVNALAEAIPTATRITTLSGAGPFELGTISETLNAAGAAITKIKVNALAGTIPLTNINGTTKVTLNDGAGHTQVFTLTAEALAGATELKVESLKPNFNYPLTTTKVEGGSFYQQWVTSAEAKAAATGIKVESLKPNFSYANAAKVEGGPFPGSYGIISNRLNEKGEEKTEGNSRGRYTNIDIEGFNINYRSIAGFEQRFQGCTFNGGVKYQFQYGDPNNTDAGGLFIDNCTFISTKKRKVATHFRWESGGGDFVNNCSFVFNPETHTAEIPEFCIDFFFEPPAKHGTTNLTVNACHIEGWESAGIRFFCSTGESVTLGNCAVMNTEIRAFTAVAGRVGVLAESAAPGHLTNVNVIGNRISEGGGAKLKNVGGYSYAGNTGSAAFTLEGGSGYPAFQPAPETTTMNASHAGSASSYWLAPSPELAPGELAEYQVLSGATIIATVKNAAPQPTIFGYTTAEVKAPEKIKEIKTKPLIFRIPSGFKITLKNLELGGHFEFKTSEEAKVGAEVIKVEEIEIVGETFPIGSQVEGGGPEKYNITAGPFFLPPSAPFELKRLDGNTYTMKISKTTAA